MADTVIIRGLTELQRALRQADPQLARVLGKAHKTIAETLVAAPARRLAASLGGGHVRLARPGVISPRGVARAAQIRLNATSYPDAFGQEFGSRQGRRKKQFDPWRGSGEEAGYALFPTIRQQQPAILDEYLDSIEQALRGAFPK
jgi:hypothetical protein